MTWSRGAGMGEGPATPEEMPPSQQGRISESGSVFCGPAAGPSPRYGRGACDSRRVRPDRVRRLAVFEYHIRYDSDTTRLGYDAS